MKRGHADLPLHYGTVPPWLAQRMMQLGGAIVESIIMEYGRTALLQRMSDPFWFQSLGCVLGMDWHSSGITTSVMNALKKAINKRSHDLGIYVCGGRGNASRQTPDELLNIADRTGLNGNELVKASRLSAKVDNTAIQDGFQLYLHSFIVTKEGEWAVVQQGMNQNERMARRYHWMSAAVKSFTEEPHTSIYGKNQGLILNLTDKNAQPLKRGILDLTRENPDKLIKEISLIMPRQHEVQAKDVNLKRLGATLALAHNTDITDIESLLLLQGVGPRTIQSLTLVSEVIHGTPSRFSDPARFSFAHGGKDGHPFPVPTSVYDETIEIFDRSIHLAKLGDKEKSEALRNLSKVSLEMERGFTPNDNFDKIIQKERDESYLYGGRTVSGEAKKPDKPKGGIQLNLFDW
ncbi:DUF763 domain-containing protein [Dysgonomonas capnocytophagoides]|uniref:DUF763 domain-containing protein n=1 Tax=Dysgonomonas capnocytophagoides TaxID=45254 RepID=A0A4Y8KVZ5_9BACT|nr:DUF763 domain-containing protein [Dysgonomonas capnocytophagoides]TFD94229.1 DUF763 domain-containing protein [Dysgonomonas capnocytophagoides]